MDSLVKSQSQQLTLFESDRMPASFFAESESTGEFTGARLFKSRPETYKAIIALTAEGIGAIRIGKILSVSPNTVLAVRAREPESIDIDKKRLSGLSREAARMCVDGIIEMLCDPKQVKNMSIKDKGIVFGILAEKSELLSGSPTQRVQNIGTPPAQEVIEYMEWLRCEYAKRIGLEGEKDCPNAGADRMLTAAPGAGPAAPGAGPAAPGAGPAADAEQAADDLPRSTAGGVDCGAEQGVDPAAGGVDPADDDGQGSEIVNRGANGEGRVFNPPVPESPANIDRDCGVGERGEIKSAGIHETTDSIVRNEDPQCDIAKIMRR
jgi:hypothetical protein